MLNKAERNMLSNVNQVEIKQWAGRYRKEKHQTCVTHGETAWNTISDLHSSHYWQTLEDDCQTKTACINYTKVITDQATGNEGRKQRNQSTYGS